MLMFDAFVNSLIVATPNNHQSKRNYSMIVLHPMTSLEAQNEISFNSFTLRVRLFLRATFQPITFLHSLMQKFQKKKL